MVSAFLRSVIPVVGLCVITGLAYAEDATAPIAGIRDKPNTRHAFVHATVIPTPGRTIEDATLVINNGRIVELRSKGVVPPNCEIHDFHGKTIYPGLIDAFSTNSTNKPSALDHHFSPLITPELSVAESIAIDSAAHAKLRKQGVTARLVAPTTGIVQGTSLLIATLDQATADCILNRNVAQHVRLGLSRNSGIDTFPNSPMGAVALARQTFLDADWYGRRNDDVALPSDATRAEPNIALSTLHKAVRSRQLFIFDGANPLYALRADSFAKEFSLNAAIRGSGEEYQRLDEIRQTGRVIIVPVNFPTAPDVSNPAELRNVSLERLMHWELAPENPARLVQGGVSIAFTTSGLSKVEDFLSGVQQAVSRGLTPEAALTALTTTPARLLGVEESLGTLEIGKRADLVVTDGDLFKKGTKILETWIAGEAITEEPAKPLDVNGEWTFTLKGAKGETRKLKLLISGTSTKPSASLQRVAPNEEKKPAIKLSKVKQTRFGLIGTVPEKSLGEDGTAQIAITFLYDAKSGKPTLAVGQWHWSSGTVEPLTLKRTTSAKIEPEKGKENEDSPSDDSDKAKSKSDEPPSDTEQKGGSKSEEESPSDSAAKPSDTKVAETISTVNFPFGAFGLTDVPDNSKPVLIRNATLWTCDKDGVIENGHLLVVNGLIERISTEPIPAPDGAILIDARGKHVTPGIIDCHSHAATDGGINESSQAITCEVRVGDFINPTDINIYRQLAGGVTCINILHGSANPIGGQNQVIKLRWGRSGDAMKMKEAPAGVKFALGENVKRSNSSPGTRYPQSRMGVEQIMRDAFQAAKEYEATWERWRTQRDIPLPRYNLELEALVEILHGKRLVHCHSYRQDEILMLLRLCEEFGIQVATLQHILEGYKVADAMSRHGATGSSFSDWFNYKIEVFDAIPFNGALMHRAGVNVSFNSDDAELARHLNHEAAKAVKYGGVEPTEALKFVTANPAKQLRIDRYVGSLTAGKQADFVIWSGDPLSILSRCEQTWIDGERYFDIESNKELEKANDALKSRLVQKVLSSEESKEPAKLNQRTSDLQLEWVNFDEFCQVNARGVQE